MASFAFKASDSRGSMIEGVEDAPDMAAVQRTLRQRGLTPLSVQPAKAGTEGGSATSSQTKGLSLFGGGDSVNRKQVLRFTSELSVLLRAGLPVDRAMKVQIDSAPEGALKDMLQQLLDRLKGGRALSTALEQYPSVFDGFYVSMVRSGEASGRVAQVLAELATYLERSAEVRSTVVSALIYPAILLVVAVISVAVMLGFVVPEFESLFEEMGDGLPLLTEVIVALGHLFERWGWVILFGAAGLWFLIRRWIGTPEGKRWLDLRALSLPLVKQVVLKFETARFARTMGTLLSNGVSVLKAASIAEGTVTNGVLRERFAELAPVLKRGGRLAEAMAPEVFSPMAVQMVTVGEESGSLDAMLVQLATVYEAEVEADTKRALTLLEPILILSMGGIIAVIIMGILMGILSVNSMAM